MKHINENVTVSPQIDLNEIADIKAQGFNIVMSNRPDGEEIGQPLTADIQAAVESAGLKFVHIPIISGQFTQEAIDGFAEVVGANDKVFAYCRTGTRCAALWALSQAGRASADDILGATSAAGYDFPQLRAHLEGADS